jgi:transcriptional regulator with XRE-family HTH domain
MKSDDPGSFGKRLRRIRKEKGIEGPDELRKLLSGKYSTSGILKRERGEIKIDLEYVEDFCTALRIDRDTKAKLLSLVEIFSYNFDLWRLHKNGVASIQFEYWKRVRESKVYKQFEPLYICSLLQTQGYAYEALRSFGLDDSASMESSAARFSMCSTLVNECSSKVGKLINLPRVLLIQDEEALYRCIGSKHVMLEQLNHLLEIKNSQNLEFRILPRNRTQQVPLGYNFNLYDDYLAVLETACGHVYVTDPDTLQLLEQWHLWMKGNSLSGGDAKKLLTRAISHYKGGR